MADEQTVDQGTVAPAAPTTTTASSAVSTSVGAGQVTAPVATGAAQGIVVGNQTFPDQQALIKAYQESMRGYTQHTQKTAKELEAYKAVSDWLGKLKADPTQWGRFTQYVYGKPDVGGVNQQAAQLQAQHGALEPQVRDTRFDEFKSDLEGRLEAQKTQVEYLTFRNHHPDVDDGVLQEVIDQTIKWDEEGKERSLEEAYRWIMAEKNAAKFVQAGRQQAETALAASQAAGGTLGTAPASATGVSKPEPKFKDMKTVKDQNNFIRDMLGRFKKSK